MLAPIANSAARNAFLNLLDYIRVNVAPDERATRVRLAYRMVGVLEVNIPEAAILLHFPLYVPRGVEGGDSLSDLSGSCTGILQGGQQPGGVVAVLHHDNIQGGDPQAVPMHENHLVVFDNEVDEARVADNENGGSNGGSRVSGDTSIEPNHQACDQEQ